MTRRLTKHTVSLALLNFALALIAGCAGASAIRAYSGPPREVKDVAVIRSLPLCEEPTEKSGSCRPGRPQGQVLPKRHLHAVVLFAVDGSPIKVAADGKPAPANQLNGSFVVHVLPGKHTLSLAHADISQGEEMVVSVNSGSATTGMAEVRVLGQVGDRMDLDVDLEAGKTYEFEEWSGAIVENGALFPDPPLKSPLPPGTSISDGMRALAEAAIASLSPIRLTSVPTGR